MYFILPLKILCRFAYQPHLKMDFTFNQKRDEVYVWEIVIML